MATQAKITLTAEDRASRVIADVQRQMAAASKTAGELSAAAGLVGPAFATLASAAGLAAFVKHVTDSVDALNDVADATGASIENLSILDNVARRNGSTFDQAADILVKFNKALGSASDPASEAARVFQGLGLSVADLKRLDPAEALQRTAVALQGYAADGDKARAVQELFGKSIREAAPFLKDLAEAGKVNATITAEQADQAERFNKALFKLNAEGENTRRTLVLTIGAGITELIDRFRTAVQVFGGLGNALGAGLREKLNFSDPADGLREYNRQVAEVDAKLKALAQSKGKSLLPDLLNDAQRQRLEQDREALAKVADYYRSLVNGQGAGAGRGTGGATPLPKLVVPPKPAKADKPESDRIDDATRALAQYTAQLERELIKTQELTTVQETAIELRRLGALGNVPQVREMLNGLSEEIDRRKQGLAFAKAMNQEMARQADDVAQLDAALAKFSGRTADALKAAQTARLEQRLAMGEQFSPEELERIVKGIAGITDEVEKATDTMGKRMEQFVENVQNALGDTLQATLRGEFDSIGKLWGNLLLKMASQALAADLSAKLFGDLGVGKGNEGNSGVFASLLASFFSFGGGKAAGGTVQPYSLQRVNENGFEVFTTPAGQDYLMTGSRGGTVTPSGQVAAAAGGPQVVNNITVAAGPTRGEVLSAVQLGMRQVESTIMARLRAQRVLA